MNAPTSRQRRRMLGLAVAAAGATFAAPLRVTRAAALPSQDKGAKAAPAPLTMGLLRNPVSGLIAITEQKGWFKAAGVDLTTVVFNGAGGPKVIQAMGGGSIGLGSVSVTAALLAIAARAVPLRIVSISTDPVPVFAILSAPEIDSMKALAGKRVATTAGTGLHYFLARALAKSGMTLADIEFVNLPVGDAQAAFLAKRVDAVVPSLTGRYAIQGLRKDTRVLFGADAFARPPGPPTRFEDYDVFIAPQAVVESSRPALRGFLAAYHGQGVPYLTTPATQNEAIAAITRYVNVEQKTPTDEASMREQLLQSRFFGRDEVRGILLSDAFRAELEDQMRFLMDSKQLPARVDVAGAIVTDLV